MNQKSVFEFGNEYQCQSFFDVDTQASGVEVSLDGKRLGSIIGLEIPDIEDEDENVKFDAEVVAWIVDNNF